MSKYNGWSNYQTWAVNLHITNDENLLTEVKAQARDFLRQFADWIEEFMEETQKPELNGMAADLFSSAWSEIDWDEIAGTFLKEV
jgi:hypothetical protein